jgi:hypothetical protein
MWNWYETPTLSEYQKTVFIARNFRSQQQVGNNVTEFPHVTLKFFAIFFYGDAVFPSGVGS